MVSLDDDFFILSMFSKGWISLVFTILMIAAIAWHCSQSSKCEGDGKIYLEDQDMCIDKELLSKP